MKKIFDEKLLYIQETNFECKRFVKKCDIEVGI